MLTDFSDATSIFAPKADEIDRLGLKGLLIKDEKVLWIGTPARSEFLLSQFGLAFRLITISVVALPLLLAFGSSSALIPVLFLFSLPFSLALGFWIWVCVRICKGLVYVMTTSRFGIGLTDTKLKPRAIDFVDRSILKFAKLANSDIGFALFDYSIATKVLVKDTGNDTGSIYFGRFLSGNGRPRKIVISNKDQKPKSVKSAEAPSIVNASGMHLGASYNEYANRFIAIRNLKSVTEIFSERIAYHQISETT